MSDYYVRRVTGHSGVFTADRYEKSYDPDGNERHPSEERQQKLDDMAEELAFLKGLAPGQLLEVGCGLGFALVEMNKHGWEVTGVEPCTDAMFRASSELSQHDLVASSLDNPNIRGRFDAVLSYHVIEHVQNPETWLCEIRELMKPHAWLVLSTPDFGSPVAEHFGNNFRLLHDPTHVSLFSRTGLHNMLTDFGFRVERVSTPFFRTRHFTRENLERLFDTTKTSPPGPGNIMTFYARRLS